MRVMVISRPSGANCMMMHVAPSARDYAPGTEAKVYCAGEETFAKAAGKIHDYKPDVLVVPGADWTRDDIEPLGEVKAGGIAVLAVWGDAVDRTHDALMLALDDAVTKHIVIDGDTGAPSKKAITLWTPVDTSLFRPLERRVLMVSFAGSAMGDRLRVLNTLSDSGISVWHKPAVTEVPFELPAGAYAAVIRSSMMSIGFARKKSDPELFQLKGRVFEAMNAGSMLLEERNAYTAKLFEDGAEYVSWASFDELKEAIERYSSDRVEIGRIANAGRVAALERYSNKRWWAEALA